MFLLLQYHLPVRAVQICWVVPLFQAFQTVFVLARQLLATSTEIVGFLYIHDPGTLRFNGL